LAILSLVGRWLLNRGDVRKKEYRWAKEFLTGCDKVLDVACGTGTFLSIYGRNSIGIDTNIENIEYCKKHDLDGRLGNALDIPFADESFDGTHCSHLMQVFSPEQAVKLIQELSRVTRANGRIVITTLNDFPTFYRHPENFRPYPPDALRRLFGIQKEAQSPMFGNLPVLHEVGIKLRHPSLVEFRFSSSSRLGKYASVFNAFQRSLGLKKWWRFDSYTICYKKSNG
jgi:SAM-dependent methyltransferase